MTDRGQTFTLEALIGAIILLAAVAFALQAVSISSNTASIADTELRGQQTGLAEGVVDRAARDGNLTAIVTYWNESGQRFHGADEEGYYISPNANTTFGNTTFGESLETATENSQIRYNIYLHYRGSDGGQATQQLVASGTPSDNAVRIFETVTLGNDTVLVAPDETARKNATVGSLEDSFYAPNVSEDHNLYNVIRVEVVLWQI